MAKRGWATDMRQPPQLRRWEVRAGDEVNIIEAHYCFDNNDDGRGLVFRRYIDDNPENRTRVVAAFSVGFWQSYKELNDDQD